MKKFVILMLFALLTTIGYSQEINVELPDSTTLTTMKVYEDVKAGLSGLAEGLKTTAEHVYVILVKQQVVNGFVGLFILITLITFTIITLNYSNNIKDWDDLEVYEGKNKASGVICITFGILSLFILSAFLIGGYSGDILTGFINPEYGAIKEIMSFVK